MNHFIKLVQHFYRGATDFPTFFDSEIVTHATAVSGHGVSLTVWNFNGEYHAIVDDVPLPPTRSTATVMRRWLNAC